MLYLYNISREVFHQNVQRIHKAQDFMQFLCDILLYLQNSISDISNNVTKKITNSKLLNSVAVSTSFELKLQNITD